jgi:hypothetical protein
MYDSMRIGIILLIIKFILIITNTPNLNVYRTIRVITCSCLGRSHACSQQRDNHGRQLFLKGTTFLTLINLNTRQTLWSQSFEST